MEFWQHIPGVENPADVPSRGAMPLELLVNKLWRNGPEVPFQHDVIEDQSDANIPLECLEDLRANEKRSVHGLLTHEVDGNGVGRLIEIQKFNSFGRLVNVLTRVLEFCSMLHRKKSPTAFDSIERSFVENLLIKDAQVSLKTHENFSKWEKQLFLFSDDNGILRYRGRIDNASNLPYLTKYPVILPGDHHLTALYVRRAHARVLHDGVKETLAELRSQFCVVKGRSVVKRILHNCCVCRRYEGKSYRVPPPPPLSAFRDREAPPFTSSGVDFV